MRLPQDDRVQVEVLDLALGLGGVQVVRVTLRLGERHLAVAEDVAVDRRLVQACLRGVLALGRVLQGRGYGQRLLVAHQVSHAAGVAV